MRRVESTAQRGKREVEGTGTDDLWQRLSAVDFMNRALILAATLLLCAVPFLLIVSTLAGHSATAGPVHGIGTVSALMSLFIAIGVVQVLGAAFGLVWTEHGSFRGALRRLRRRQP